MCLLAIKHKKETTFFRVKKSVIHRAKRSYTDSHVDRHTLRSTRTDRLIPGPALATGLLPSLILPSPPDGKKNINFIQPKAWSRAKVLRKSEGSGEAAIAQDDRGGLWVGRGFSLS